MNNSTPINVHVPLRNLAIAPENPRRMEPDRNEIAALADNIRHIGLLTPLIVYKADSITFVTAGSRRLAALQMLHAEGVINDKYSVPVTLMEVEEAVIAGQAEQLAHVRLDPLDELRIYLDGINTTSDADLAIRTARTPRYVAQRRAILNLPEEMAAATFSQAITIDQAIALTYLKYMPEKQQNCFERAYQNPHFTAREIRNQHTYALTAWNKLSYTDERVSYHVTQDEYLAAGGRLQSDLFADESYILDMDVMETIATTKAIDHLRGLHPDVAFILKTKDLNEFYTAPRHPGVSGLTAEEEERLEAYYAMDFIASGSDEALDYEDLQDRSGGQFPDDLRNMLGVMFRLYSGQSRHVEEPSSFIDARFGYLPEDLNPLYESGYMVKPADRQADVASETDPVDDSAKISETQALRISRIRAQVARILLSRDSDSILSLYTQNLANRYSYDFAQTPDFNASPQREDEFTTNKSFDHMAALDDSTAEDVAAMKPAEVRKLLAFKMLKCLRLGSSPTKALSAEEIRSVWSPNKIFLYGYKSAQLVKMIDPDSTMSLSEQKDNKTNLVAKALHYFTVNAPSALPLGF